MEVLKNVMIKESHGVDKVFIVDNLPKDLLYRKVLKLMVDYTNPQQNLVPAFELDEKGRKIPTHEMTEELQPGVEKSQNGDDSYVFYMEYNEAKERLATIDRYIEKTLPQSERIPERVSYAAQRGLMTSTPTPTHLIPRVVLPELVSPPAVEAAQAPAPRENSVAVNPANRQIQTEEQKQTAKERMAKARAARKVAQK